MNKRIFSALFGISLMTCLLPGLAKAEDTVRLKNGTVLTGTIAARSSDETMIFFVPAGGGSGQWVSMSEVESMSLNPVLKENG